MIKCCLGKRKCKYIHFLTFHYTKSLFSLQFTTSPKCKTFKGIQGMLENGYFLSICLMSYRKLKLDTLHFKMAANTAHFQSRRGHVQTSRRYTSRKHGPLVHCWPATYQKLSLSTVLILLLQTFPTAFI